MNRGTKKAFPHFVLVDKERQLEHCSNGVLCTLILTQIEWREQVMKKREVNSLVNELNSLEVGAV